MGGPLWNRRHSYSDGWRSQSGGDARPGHADICQVPRETGHTLSFRMRRMKKINRGTGCDSAARVLIYFPIIHTQTDMGALSESLRRVTVRKLGEKGWKRQVNAIEKMWKEIEEVIDRLGISYERARLYQDGLAVCDREADIVRDLAKAGSRNHQLLLRLMERGARIMGTESSDLLVEEYELVKQLLAKGDAGEGSRNENRLRALSASLLKKRDQYIAHRINNTLRQGETGILFLGMLHSLDKLLDGDIRVVYPTNRPLHHGGKRNAGSRRPRSDC